MGIGLGIFLAILGAVLYFGITENPAGLNLDAIGVIFMVAGAVVFVVTLLFSIMGGEPNGERRLPGREQRDHRDQQP